MRRWTVVVAGAVLLTAFARMAGASQGEELSRKGLADEAGENKALARYLRRNGLPDLASRHALPDQAPWDDHEVTLYYFDSHKEISFARARILGSPQIHLQRYQRTLTDADVRALRSRVGLATTNTGFVPCTGSAPERAECAATRAENAADRVDVAAGRAERAADRTEAIIEKMSAPAPRAHVRRSAP